MGIKKNSIRIKKRESYRLHVARSFTVIYNIDSDDNLVYITHIMSIEKAHREIRTNLNRPTLI